MRRMSYLWVTALIATLGGWVGCSDDDNGGQCPSVYCDDSGCHACDPDTCYCWDISNSSCEQGCEDGQFCTSDGICAARCSYDGECAEGERCLPEGYCGPEEQPNLECTSDDDCGAGRICESDGNGGMVCQSAECLSDDDCDSGYVCADCGRCVPAENPVCGDTKRYCESNDDCGAGRVCNESGKCIYQCQETGDCPFGQICSADNVCVDGSDPSHEGACVYSSDCAQQEQCQELGCLCVNTYCRSLCNDTSDCGDKELCDMGVCRPNYRPE